MILVDTSVWLLNKRRLRLEDFVKLDEIAVCGPVIQEVLQGTELHRLEDARSVLLNCQILSVPLPLGHFEYAAEIYRTARIRGYKPRSPVDCLIAAIAILNHVPLLHADRDFDFIAKVANLDARNIIPSASAARS
jgi:predicted nucleic acid-binding protein